MNGEPQFPAFTAPSIGPRRWRIVMANGQERVVEGVAIRVEGGALMVCLPVGAAAAFAPGTWSEVGPVDDGGVR